MNQISNEDLGVLQAIASHQVEAGTPINHFVDYCDNAIGGDPEGLMAKGLIDVSNGHVEGLTEAGQKIVASHQTSTD